MSRRTADPTAEVLASVRARADAYAADAIMGAASRPKAAQFLQTRDATIATVGYWSPTHTFHATGTSRRDGHDEHSPEVGELLAMSRAYEKLARRLARQANAMVKHADDVRNAPHKPLSEWLAEQAATAERTRRDEVEAGRTERARRGVGL